MQLPLNIKYTKTTRIIAHIAFWLVYLFAYILISLPSGRELNILLLNSFFTLPIDILATYFTIYFLIPKYLINKKYIEFIIFFIISAFTIILIARLITYFVYIPLYFPELLKTNSFWKFNFFTYSVSTYAVVFLASAIKLTKYWFIIEKQRSTLINEKLQNELAFLRSQLHPHFIFNTLNNIDSLIYSDKQAASKSIIKLSEILRYMLYESNSEKVLLQKEIEYIKNFIDLQLLRIKDKNFIYFAINGNTETHIIAPLLFIPLVENAIKHGDKSVESPGIFITLSIINNTLFFEVINYFKEENKTMQFVKIGGIGIPNLKRRLELLYPGKYNFSTQAENNMFAAKLQIELH